MTSSYAVLLICQHILEVLKRPLEGWSSILNVKPLCDDSAQWCSQNIVVLLILVSAWRASTAHYESILHIHVTYSHKSGLTKAEKQQLQKKILVRSSSSYIHTVVKAVLLIGRFSILLMAMHGDAVQQRCATASMTDLSGIMRLAIWMIWMFFVHRRVTSLPYGPPIMRTACAIVPELSPPILHPLGSMLTYDSLVEICLLLPIMVIATPLPEHLSAWLLAPANIFMANICPVCSPTCLWKTATLDDRIQRLGRYQDDKCVHCWDKWVTGQKAAVLQCEHVFHDECMLDWVKSSGSGCCPVCRQPIWLED
ncbi:hypothetical protein PMZ80_007156 [Knufia obscura]|uniref:RING-type domain-containing protein n=1 Tax=Knufia obscura TaxID=1635080 RepID=A0ABR0RJD8_9EURO|nr:hypothetical protein PMZ80_007156 [Knufia obscura]